MQEIKTQLCRKDPQELTNSVRHLEKVHHDQYVDLEARFRHLKIQIQMLRRELRLVQANTGSEIAGPLELPCHYLGWMAIGSPVSSMFFLVSVMSRGLFRGTLWFSILNFVKYIERWRTRGTVEVL